ncbi:MAG: hypothetical protein ACYS0K_19295, partial [Planctomycetota bacterium]
MIHRILRKKQGAPDVRHGHEDSSEADLVDAASRLLLASVKRAAGTWRIGREIGVGRAVTDIVLARLRSDSWAAAFPLSVRESVVLSALRTHGPTRIDVLENRCGVGRRSLRGKALARLRNAGAFESGPGGR